jgi:Holliday junction resolvase
MTGRKSKAKGYREEHQAENDCQAAGFAAERIPLSGAAGGKFSGDISIPLLGRDLIAEVKVRRDGFRELYRWLGQNDLLFVRANRQRRLVILSWDLAVKIAQAAEHNKND